MLRLTLRPTVRYRIAAFLIGDALIWVGALWGAFFIRFDGAIPPRYLAAIPVLLAVLVPIKLAWYAAFRLYRITWRSVGLTDLMNVGKANTLALLTVTTLALLLRTTEVFGALPRSVLLLDYVLTTCGVAVFRAGRRGWQLERERYRRRRNANGTRLLIVGAGAAGTRILQTIREAGGQDYRPVGFVDDDPAKQGADIKGLRVLGDRRALPRIVAEHGVEEVLIAIPSAPPARLPEIIADVRRAGVRRIKIVPGMHEWLTGRVGLKDIRDVDVGDLLRRAPARIQYDAIKTYLAGKRVLVTGAAGSIGSELVRQLTRFDLEEVIALDINESGLFELEQELAQQLSHPRVRTVIADVRDAIKVDRLVAVHRPQLVLHAAAYKHVPMMEREVDEAVKTNVLGTLHVAEAALAHGVETFVLISTDKAVNPTSVMGASKRLGELICQAVGRRDGTRFLAVRFGNVLGSRGSIIPVLLDQIRRGGPVTVTHPDMVRYFMTLPEAVLLVLETPLLISRGPIFMLDMGEPLRIVDLVGELVRLLGLEADRDIPIVYGGVRPGEKMEEELTLPDEHRVPTVFERILEVRPTQEIDEATLRQTLRELEALTQAMDGEALRALLQHAARPEGTPRALAAAPAGETPATG